MRWLDVRLWPAMPIRASPPATVRPAAMARAARLAVRSAGASFDDGAGPAPAPLPAPPGVEVGVAGGLLGVEPPPRVPPVGAAFAADGAEAGFRAGDVSPVFSRSRSASTRWI